MDEQILKAAHYRSFYEAAKKIKNSKARLAFYDALDAYRFEGIEPVNLPYEADLVFTAIRKVVDASNNILARKTKEYSIWTNSVFSRDKYTCQECGKTGGKLNAHHIKRFAKDIANRFNVANGVTLCVNCHKYVHKVEGR